MTRKLIIASIISYNLRVTFVYSIGNSEVTRFISTNYRPLPIRTNTTIPVIYIPIKPDHQYRS